MIKDLEIGLMHSKGPYKKEAEESESDRAEGVKLLILEMDEGAASQGT